MRHTHEKMKCGTSGRLTDWRVWEPRPSISLYLLFTVVQPFLCPLDFIWVSTSSSIFQKHTISHHCPSEGTMSLSKTLQKWLTLSILNIQKPITQMACLISVYLWSSHQCVILPIFFGVFVSYSYHLYCFSSFTHIFHFFCYKLPIVCPLSYQISHWSDHIIWTNKYLTTWCKLSIIWTPSYLNAPLVWLRSDHLIWGELAGQSHCLWVTEKISHHLI